MEKYEGENKNHLYFHYPKITALNILIHFVSVLKTFCLEKILEG